MLDRILYKRDIVWPIIYDFFNEFKQKWPNIKCNIVGSVRREQENIHDFDLIIGSKNKEIMIWCAEKIQSKNYFPSNIKIDGILKNIPIQIWFCDEIEYGLYLLLKTGPLNFNQKLATVAKKQGLTLSEHGLFIGTPENKIKRIDENTEANVIWILLGCKWIHPKERY
ncbi:MAG: hypothetical protein E6L00_03500 [Thaumarchaeota archaeon]|nr:MAG: hypothetical protein E6L00_03500 [Nitrososphaerota archaeon]